MVSLPFYRFAMDGWSRRLGLVIWLIAGILAGGASSAHRLRATEPATARSTLPEAPSQANPTDLLFEHSAFGPDYDRFRERLLDAGFSFRVADYRDFQGNVVGGDRHGVGYTGQTAAFLDLDLERLLGFHATAVHISVAAVTGPLLSAQYIHNFQDVSSVTGVNRVRLCEIWVERFALDGRVALRLGQLSAHDEFCIQDLHATFLNDAFGTTRIKQNLHTPATPIAEPGVRLRLIPTSSTYVKLGVYEGVPDVVARDPHGVAFRLDGNAIVAAEAGYHFHDEANSPGLGGNYKVGILREFGAFARFNDRSIPDPGYGDELLYGMAAQELWRANDQTEVRQRRGIILGLAVAASPQGSKNRVVVETIAQLRFHGLIPGREQDSFGIAFADTRFSPDYTHVERLAGRPDRGGEQVAELTYQWTGLPGVLVQPDLQIVFHPDGVGSRSPVLVPGVRTVVTF